VEYLQSFGSEEKKLAVLDELESVYENIDDVKTRLQMLRANDFSTLVMMRIIT
jgi:hypothetical protein